MTPAKGPRFSIVSPSFRQGEYIDATIQSIIEQDSPGLEHIVIDGGSDDATLDVLRARQQQYNLRWISEPDNGLYEALNKGLKLATGNWIGWLNCDDLYPAGLLRRAAEIITKNPDVEMICGDAEVFRDTGSGKQQTLYTDQHYRGTRFLPTEQNLAISHLNACLIRKSLLDRAGPFDSSYKIIADRDMMFRLMSLAPKSIHIAGTSCRYRSHAGSITMSSLSSKNKAPVFSIDQPASAEMIRLTERYIARKDIPPEIAAWCKRTLARLRAGHAAKQIFSLNLGSFATEMGRCLKLDKSCPYYFFRSFGHRLKCSFNQLVAKPTE